MMITEFLHKIIFFYYFVACTWPQLSGVSHIVGKKCPRITCHHSQYSIIDEWSTCRYSLRHRVLHQPRSHGIEGLWIIDGLRGSWFSTPSTIHSASWTATRLARRTLDENHWCCPPIFLAAFFSRCSQEETGIIDGRGRPGGSVGEERNRLERILQVFNR